MKSIYAHHVLLTVKNIKGCFASIFERHIPTERMNGSILKLEHDIFDDIHGKVKSDEHKRLPKTNINAGDSHSMASR